MDNIALCVAVILVSIYYAHRNSNSNSNKWIEKVLTIYKFDKLLTTADNILYHFVSALFKNRYEHSLTI